MFETVKDFFRRQPFVGACIILCLISLGAMWWISRQTGSYAAELERVTKQGTETLGLVAMRNMLEDELDRVESALRRTDDNLVIEDNLAENLWYFYSVEGRTQTRLTELRQLDTPRPAQGETFLRVPYELSATGDFVGISEFLRQLETGPRLMRIREFSLQRGTAEDQLISLTLSLEMLGRL